jgi:hypothetical protein
MRRAPLPVTVITAAENSLYRPAASVQAIGHRTAGAPMPEEPTKRACIEWTLTKLGKPCSLKTLWMHAKHWQAVSLCRCRNAGPFVVVFSAKEKEVAGLVELHGRDANAPPKSGPAFFGQSIQPDGDQWSLTRNC